MSDENKISNPKRFRELLGGARQAQEIARRHRAQERWTMELLRQPWSAFAESAEKYLEVFEEFFPGVSKSVRGILLGLNNGAGKAIGVDMSGIADAGLVGASRTVCMTLTNQNFPDIEGRTIVTGDILTHKGETLLLKEIGNSPVGVCFFRPIAAALKYTRNEFAYLKMGKLLSKMYERIVPGGELLVDIRWIPAEGDNLDSQFRELFVFKGATVTQGIAEDKMPRNIFRISKPV